MGLKDCHWVKEGGASRVLVLPTRLPSNTTFGEPPTVLWTRLFFRSSMGGLSCHYVLCLMGNCIKLSVQLEDGWVTNHPSRSCVKVWGKVNQGYCARVGGRVPKGFSSFWREGGSPTITSVFVANFIRISDGVISSKQLCYSFDVRKRSCVGRYCFYK